MLVLNGAMTVGGIQSALQYVKTFQQPFSTFAQMSSQLSSAMAAGSRIFELLDAEEEVPDPEPGKVPTACDGSEQALQNAMAVLLKGLTSFVIAHRLSTIRDADVILYMEDGDIKEVGDHDTLMKMGGKYTALYNSQFG